MVSAGYGRIPGWASGKLKKLDKRVKISRQYDKGTCVKKNITENKKHYTLCTATMKRKVNKEGESKFAIETNAAYTVDTKYKGLGGHTHTYTYTHSVAA